MKVSLRSPPPTNTVGLSHEVLANATLRGFEELLNSSLSVLNHTCSHGSLIEAENARCLRVLPVSCQKYCG